MATVLFAGVPPSPISYSKRRPLALTQRRLEANRRNAARSTGPRTAKGKARVTRNAIKHGFFADSARWTAQQHRDFAETFVGLCDDFKPQSEREQICVAVIADSFVRMAAMWRYEGIAALKYHQQCDRAMNERIAAAEPSEAARLEAHREKLRRAGVWTPTIPGPREAAAIIRYEGRLNRAIRDATAELDGLKATRTPGISHRNVQKQTHFVQQSRAISGNRDSKSGLNPPPVGQHSEGAAAGVANVALDGCEIAKTNRRETPSSGVLSRCGEAPRTPHSSTFDFAKTNPLSPAFAGNRRERRRAAALARRRR